MKAFYVIFLLVFLASCGSEAIVSESPNVEQSQQETLEELDSEIESLSSDDDVENEAVSESSVVILDAGYTNPKGPVDMVIEYELSDDSKVESIEVSASSYDLSTFNSEIQSVVWMTLEEASEVYVSGSSLTTAAFSSAIKEAK